jgi:hypothetical protein
MTRLKCLLAVLVVAAIAAVVPAAHAQSQACQGISGCTVHVVGDGSSAQFLQAGIGADSLALTVPNTGYPQNSANATNCNLSGQANAVYHWSLKNGANILDVRDSNIGAQLGNIWIVWTAACSDTTGSTGITDVWTDVSEDSTVGVRTFYAAESSGSGAQIQVLSTGPAGNLIAPQGLFPDNAPDVTTLPAALESALGTASNGSANLHVNVGLTDIRPEDALFATARTNSALTANLSGLGYKSSTAACGYTDANVACAYLTAQGTGTSAQPVNFALSGTDPISKAAVRSSITVPIGAAPVAFFFNNASSGYYPINAVTGVAAGGPYSLANLFDGSTNCTNDNAAFTSFYNGGSITSTPPPVAAINLVLREPLSGTMNTTEWNVFRTTNNSTDSQEAGVGAPPTNNALQLGCDSGTGAIRERAIGTGEVVNAVNKTGNAANANGNTLGYIFYSFANAAKFKGAPSINYLTIDGADPIGPSPAGDYQVCSGGTAPNNDGAGCATSANCTAGAGGTAGTCAAPLNTAQLAPNCTGPCPEYGFPGGVSFPNLRNGTYPVWSMYRWVVEDDIESEADTLGPAHLAYATNNVVDSTDADYVPFVSGYTCQGGGVGNNDGTYCYNNSQCTNGATCQQTVGATPDSLDVYRSHFQRCTSYKKGTTTCTAGDLDVPSNGTLTITGTTIGGDGKTNGTPSNETGGDVGGVIVVPNVAPTAGQLAWCPSLKGVEETVYTTNGSATVTFDKGYEFAAASATSADLNLNLAANNTIWLFSGSPATWVDFTVSSVTNAKTLVLTTNVTQNHTAKKTAVQACFDQSPINLPGPIGLKR